ncbi:MAG TPA: hypothetical protein VGX50_03550, partial [Longimicrobium sp.]|nr:hypothetical protein [Longimicrobium sp.]
MPETTSFLDALPKPDTLKLDSLPSDPSATLSIDLGLGSVGEELGKVHAGEADPLAEAPDLGNAPSPAAIQRALDEPLNAAKAIDGPALIARARATLPTQAPAPAFDVQGPIKGITDQLLPPGAAIQMPSEIPMPEGIGDFSAPLRRLAEVGAATPMKLLQAMLAVLDKLVNTATDVDRLRQYTVEALGEILAAQSGALSDGLPLPAL